MLWFGLRQLLRMKFSLGHYRTQSGRRERKNQREQALRWTPWTNLKGGVLLLLFTLSFRVFTCSMPSVSFDCFYRVGS